MFHINTKESYAAYKRQLDATQDKNLGVASAWTVAVIAKQILADHLLISNLSSSANNISLSISRYRMKYECQI